MCVTVFLSVTINKVTYESLFLCIICNFPSLIQTSVHLTFDLELLTAKSTPLELAISFWLCSRVKGRPG